MSTRVRKSEARLRVSLTDKDYKALNVLADKEDVSASWLVRRAVEEYLRQRRHGIGPSTATLTKSRAAALKRLVRPGLDTGGKQGGKRRLAEKRMSCWA